VSSQYGISELRLLRDDVEQIRNRQSEESRQNVRSTFEVFVEHNDFILAVIRSRCRYDVDVEDVYQDLFLNMVSKPVPRDVESVRRYLYGAIVMRVGSAVRRVRRHRSSLYEYVEKAQPHTRGRSPEKTAIIKDEIERALKLIERGCLKRSEARAIKLRYMNNWGPRDVADEMGVDVRSVSRYISMGLKRIRLLMRQK